MSIDNIFLLQRDLDPATLLQLVRFFVIESSPTRFLLARVSRGFFMLCGLDLLAFELFYLFLDVSILHLDEFVNLGL